MWPLSTEAITHQGPADTIGHPENPPWWRAGLGFGQWLARRPTEANLGAQAATTPKLSSSPPRWTISAEAIVLGRLGGINRMLVERAPGTTPFDATSTAPSTPALNANQFHPGLSAGPKLGLTWRGESGYGAELSYFSVFGQSASRATGPTSPPDWLVIKAPGTFWQTQDFAYQAMRWKATTSLYGAEANGRFDLSGRVTLLA